MTLSTLAAVHDLPSVLQRRAADRPHDVAAAFLVDGETEVVARTNAELDGEARRIASVLAAEVAPGGRAVVLHPPGLDFVSAFLACLYAKVVAVAAPPPAPPRLEAGLAALSRVVEDSRPDVVLCPAGRQAPPASTEHPPLGAVRWMASDDRSEGDADAFDPRPVSDEDPAFLQYTSGSTTAAKATVISHGSLAANQRALSEFLHIPAGQPVVSWLPPYHDMGLIGTVLHPLWCGAPTYLMSPRHFLERPARWLEAMSGFRAYATGAPNFGYELAVRRVPAEARESLDLSRWEVAFCGAEPVRASTVHAFVERFAPQGFRPSAFVGCYGLAEATLMVSGARAGDPHFLIVDRAALGEGRADVVGGGDPGAVTLVSCGGRHGDDSFAVVDPLSRTVVPDGVVAEVWFRGPSVAAGYWERPDETSTTFGATLADGSGPYLRTGDLGFLREGSLYVTGRIKDVLIVRGRNVQPHDVEEVAEASHPACRPGGSAAVSWDDGDREQVVVVQETRSTDPPELAEQLRRIRAAVLERCEVLLADVYLVPPRAVLRTTSGKVRRAATRDALRSGSLPVLASTSQCGLEAGPVP